MSRHWLPWACLALLLILGTVNAESEEHFEEVIPPIAASELSDPAWNEIGDPDESAMDQSFLISLLMIIVSEIGDKTFLIAAIMAMKHSRLVVFAAAFSSLALMSVLSACLGHVVPNLVPKQYTDIMAALMFLAFGFRMIWEAYHMDDQEGQEEMTEVEEELKVVEDRERANRLESLEVGGMEHKQISKPQKIKEGLMNLMQLVFSPVFVQTFVLTFLGEWGDRSQISTIALAAANDVYWVTAGVIIGHTMCTALAVIGGRMLAAKISVKTVTFAGAVLFLVFGVFYGYHAYKGQMA
ncbi:hypothetical protein DFQ28_006381 [Apophysomyces sp. BC1034]|nr:hypothetical protein DFQ30_006243 [Apophysomyces sp. BC1015]KAG0177125.1 hypothetical protein DFQ29_005212 [Apophysomyces sp. BC1021]KAG0187417.1 hypothetical protein DFQ28_006381 [Apophysomyces sp. BC1034]